jgi:hypothetical protein
VVFGTAMLASLPEGRAGHSSASPSPAPITGLPLRSCRPLHLAAEPSEFRPGEAARRFTVFVEADCGNRSGPIIVEVWYRALYYDGARRVLFGTPQLVKSVATRTELVKVGGDGRRDLSYFDIPATGWYLHLGCYVARVRMPAVSDLPGRTSPTIPGAIAEEVGEAEACAVPPRPSLPRPRSGAFSRPRQE